MCIGSTPCCLARSSFWLKLSIAIRKRQFAASTPCGDVVNDNFILPPTARFVVKKVLFESDYWLFLRRMAALSLLPPLDTRIHPQFPQWGRRPSIHPYT